MPDEDRRRAAHRALVDRILSGKGRASAEQRAHAFGNDGLSPPLDELIGKVAGRPVPGDRGGLRRGEGVRLQ